MSYSLIGKFVDVKNKKRIIDAELDFLKNLNDTRYSCRFSDITSSSKTKDDDFPDVTTYVEHNYIGYYKREVMETDWAKGAFYKYNKPYGNPGIGYTVEKKFFEEHDSDFKEFEVRPTVEEMMKGFDADSNTICLYTRENARTSGIWYTASDFEKGKEIIEKEYNELLEKKRKLDALKYSKDWYGMKEAAKNEFLEDYGYLSEDLEDAEWKVWSINKIINILDFMNDNVGFRQVDEYGETSYVWNYDDERQIEVYIEVD